MGLKKECKDSACYEDAMDNCEEAFFGQKLLGGVEVRHEVGKEGDVCRVTNKYYAKGEFGWGSVCTRSFPIIEGEDWECESITVTED
jgi:hypothetical protein